MILKDTIKMMTSTDYKERFRAEYYQLEIRLKGLKAMLEKWDNGSLAFTPTSTRETYDKQLQAMIDYISVLEIRAYEEGIEL